MCFVFLFLTLIKVMVTLMTSSVGMLSYMHCNLHTYIYKQIFLSDPSIPLQTIIGTVGQQVGLFRGLLLLKGKIDNANSKDKVWTLNSYNLLYIYILFQDSFMIFKIAFIMFFLSNVRWVFREIMKVGCFY